MDERVVLNDDLVRHAGPATTGKPVKSVAYQTDVLEVASFRLPPGAVITAHVHTSIRDVFVGLGGRGRIRYEEDGVLREHDLLLHSFCALPPNVPHEVRNVDESEDLVFLLMHAPFAGYDHVKLPPEEAVKLRAEGAVS